MADDTQKVTFRAVGWSMTAACDLSRIADASFADIKTFAREVSRGNWQLWDILADGERVGCVLWSVENDSDGHTLIINAAYARPVRGACVVNEILDTFSALGKRSGASALRCWTVREGMRRKLEKQGATRRYVMEIDL